MWPKPTQLHDVTSESAFSRMFSARAAASRISRSRRAQSPVARALSALRSHPPPPHPLVIIQQGATNEFIDDCYFV